MGVSIFKCFWSIWVWYLYQVKFSKGVLGIIGITYVLHTVKRCSLMLSNCCFEWLKTCGKLHMSPRMKPKCKKYTGTKSGQEKGRKRISSIVLFMKKLRSTNVNGVIHMGINLFLLTVRHIVSFKVSMEFCVNF